MKEPDSPGGLPLPFGAVTPPVITRRAWQPLLQLISFVSALAALFSEQPLAEMPLLPAAPLLATAGGSLPPPPFFCVVPPPTTLP